jgi:hypothetical protein
MRLSALLALALTSAAQPSFESAARPVLQKYCFSCHSTQEKPAGNVRLHVFKDDESMRADLRLWNKVLDLIRAEQMPPSSAPQPSAADRERLIAFIEHVLDTSGDGNPGRPVSRRLTRLEFNNTVRDLLGLDTDLFMFPERLPFVKSYFRPSAGQLGRAVDAETIEYGQKIPVLLRSTGLPGENKAEYGFNNRGDSLNITPLMLEKYMAVAAEIASHSELELRSPAVRLLTADPGDRPPRPVAQERLRAFMERAWRRAPTDGDVERYLQPFDRAIRNGAEFGTAMKSSLRAILASPAFLMRVEAAHPGSATRPLDSYELASRLSYFLWATMPDEELLTLARSGALEQPRVLEQQALRMLRDPKVRELSESFAVQWLQLTELFGAQPDEQKFKNYYGYDVFGTNKFNLGMDMLTEALLLFETVLIENRSIREFVDAPYTWLNTRLMKHYGLESLYPKQVKEAAQFGSRKGPSRWFRVELPDATRGGFLTMGAPLTMNSTPLRTSPVFRGAWILEAIFNRPPPPPPNAVPTLEEQAADDSKLTVRQQLEMHRKNPACASCHNRMDPLGFALENFDPVGAWRNHDGISAVDASGKLSHSRVFNGPGEFKKSLIAREDEFVRGFIEHLLSYALGRKLEYYDAAAVKRIMTGAKAHQYRFQAIVSEVVKSRPFRYVNKETRQ